MQRFKRLVSLLFLTFLSVCVAAKTINIESMGLSGRQDIPLSGYEGVDSFSFHWRSFELTKEHGNDSRQVVNIVAIHGTPGNWETWQTLLKETQILNDDFNFYAIDRPGWGKSKNKHLNVLSRFSDQSLIVGAWLKQHFSEQDIVILLAHSWGGPIALQLAVDHAELVDGVVAVASPFDPKLSKPRWYHKLAKTRLISALIGAGLRRSNQEMLALDAELDALSTQLALVTAPVILVQGEKDFLVNHKNADFALSALVSATVSVQKHADKGHFIPFKDPEMIYAALAGMREKLKPL